MKGAAGTSVFSGDKTPCRDGGCHWYLIQLPGDSVWTFACHQLVYI